jgi:GNAT superfamily N-acetyltransferase
MRLREITKIPRSDYNPKEPTFKLWPEISRDYKRTMRPLPGGGGFSYVTMSGNNYNREIVILDPQNLGYYVGALSLERARTIPENTWQATLINVHPKYRGRGIAKSLYRLALLPKPDGLGLTLVSDSTQTPGGVRNWLSLSQMPGVEVTGLVAVRRPVKPSMLAQFPEMQNNYEKIMDDLLGVVGGVYHSENVDFYFFEIPVKVMGSKLENAIKKSLINIYPKGVMMDHHTLLMAKYDGGI